MSVTSKSLLQGLLVLSIGIAVPQIFAGDVRIQRVVFEKRGDVWNVDTTLRHADSGWTHYADAWRVLDKKGNILGTRTLHHPHVDEQPFTRSLGNLKIPEDNTVVFVEAHDKVHGWSTDKLKIDLSKGEGRNFKVIK